MKTRILIALIASLQLAGPALALEQSDWITPDTSADSSQVDIVGTPTTTVNTTAPSNLPMSGWIKQDDQIQGQQSAPAAAPAPQAQSSQSGNCTQSTGTGQSQWVSSNAQTGQSQWVSGNGQSDQTQLQGKVSKSHGCGSGAASAVGSAIGHAAGGLAAAAVAVPMMMAASRMMYGGYGGYPYYGGFRTYGPGGYRYNPGMGMAGMMGGYMLQNAAFNMLRGL